MNNAELFKKVFGIYAEEFWAFPEEKMLDWIASDAPDIYVGKWIPVTERLPIEEFEEGRKNRTVYDIYPCLVTRYSTHTDEPRSRTYVCKSYFDGEDFMLHGGYAPDERSDTENTLAWMPLPKPYEYPPKDFMNPPEGSDDD